VPQSSFLHLLQARHPRGMCTAVDTLKFVMHGQRACSGVYFRVCRITSCTYHTAGFCFQSWLPDHAHDVLRRPRLHNSCDDG